MERKYALNRSKKIYRRIAGVLSVSITVLLLVGFVYVYYMSYVKYMSSTYEINEVHFSEIASAGKTLVLDYFEKITDEVNYSGQILSIVETDSDSINSFFEKQLKNTKADKGILVLSDGSLLYGDQDYYALFQKSAKDALASDDSSISNIVECKDGIKRFAIASALTMKDGKEATVMMLYPQSVLRNLIESTILSNEGRLCIIDSNGSFVAKQTLMAAWVDEGKYLVDGDLKNRLFVVSSISNDKKYCAYSKPLGINDWFIVYIMPKEILDEQIQVGSNRIHIFGTASFIFCLFMVGYGTYKNFIRSRRLRLFRMKFKIATSQSARAAFQYDKRSDRLRLISECEHISLPKPYLSLSELANLVHPADRGAYGQSVIELRRDGKTSSTVRVSHFGGTEEYRWYHVTATRLTEDGEGRALTIGTVEDIDEFEQERLSLSEKATTDCLTGLCNRSETEKTINERLEKLEENEHSAFAIIDLDDFKNINDDFGHDCGDRALIFFSEKLRATFRFGDVIGRLGGDEFVVYMTLTSDRKVVERRIQELMESLKMKRADDNTDMPDITCSIGCCIASKGDTFEVLYKRADSALYESKTLGKGLATIA